MGQSLVNNYLHIVFNTKGVKSLTYPPIEKELHVYITGICNILECPAHTVNKQKGAFKDAFLFILFNFLY